MSWKPNLGSLWPGPWDYNSSAGVGLRFEGWPTDIYAFRQFLGENGCHQDASQRILDRMQKNGYDMLTVAAQRDFPFIARHLATLGVTMTIIPPLDDWHKRFEDIGPFRDDFLPPHMRKGVTPAEYRRLLQLQDSKR